jgi:hypothetical protein
LALRHGTRRAEISNDWYRLLRTRRERPISRAAERFTTLPHFSVSSAMILPKSAGELGNTFPPKSAIRRFSLGSSFLRRGAKRNPAKGKHDLRGIAKANHAFSMYFPVRSRASVAEKFFFQHAPWPLQKQAIANGEEMSRLSSVLGACCLNHRLRPRPTRRG